MINEFYQHFAIFQIHRPHRDFYSLKFLTLFEIFLLKEKCEWAPATEICKPFFIEVYVSVFSTHMLRTVKIW